MTKRNLYDADVLEDVLERLSKINADTQPEWGKMDAAQMFAHCAEVQDAYNGKPIKVAFWMRLLKPMWRPLLLAEKPFGKNAPTLDQFRMADPEDFDRQRDRLLDSLRTMHALGKRTMQHPLLGHMSSEDIGWITYKHMDHHLQQFGV